MLVLTRKAGGKIKIGDNVVVNILSIEGGTVKIGIDAPREVNILRMEVLEQIQNENIAAASKDITEISAAADLFKKKLSSESEKEDEEKKD